MLVELYMCIEMYTKNSNQGTEYKPQTIQHSFLILKQNQIQTGYIPPALTIKITPILSAQQKGNWITVVKEWSLSLFQSQLKHVGGGMGCRVVGIIFYYFFPVKVNWKKALFLKQTILDLS